MKMKDVDVSVLPNYGILNIELDDEMMDYLWDLIIKTSPKAKWDGRKLLEMEDYNDKQWSIKDEEHVFAEKVLQPAAGIYFDNFGTPFKLKSTHEHQLAFSRFWCRAATRGDYQSLHNHQGIFTFVVWMRIPFDGKKERLLDIFGSEDSDRFRVVSSLNDLKGSSGVLMANEFLDAMPIERLRWREGEWWRICVASDPQKATPFHEVEAPIQDPELAGLVDDLPIHLEDGFTIELNTNLKQWFHDLAQNFNMLYCCLIDYGFEGGEVFSPSRKGGTLRGYLRHRFQNCPFDAPGMTDLTAHVDFDRVKKSATSVGFDILNFTDQHRFLVNAARPWLLEIEGVGSTEDENRQLLKQFQTLSHPTMMGGVFKVLEIGRGVTAP